LFLGDKLPAEPPVKRTTAIFDGQNLFRAVRPGFGRTDLNYDVKGFAPAPAA
jgi:hypothetical protein